MSANDTGMRNPELGPSSTGDGGGIDNPPLDGSTGGPADSVSIIENPPLAAEAGPAKTGDGSMGEIVNPPLDDTGGHGHDHGHDDDVPHLDASPKTKEKKKPKRTRKK
ncbi:MAG: hypothetical protein AB3N20_11655 [Rhizobiaceae bacterium]